MRRRKFPKPAETPAPPADRVGWFTWTKKDGRRAQPHAVRVTAGVRATKTLCHNAPGVASGEVVEVEPNGDRCASCEDVVRRKGVRRGNAVSAPARPPRKYDPKTLYEPVNRFEDWDR